MRAVVMHEPGNVTVEDMPMPSILEPTDAIIKLAATCICGSDLWPYRGAQPVHERRMGHEYVGTVTEVGSAVTTVKPGDFVVGSFCISLMRAMPSSPRSSTMSVAPNARASA